VQTVINGLKKLNYLWVIALLVIMWWSLSALLETAALPSPWLAFASFFSSLQDGLLVHIEVSLYRVLSSLVLATLLGVPLGLFLGKNPQVDKYVALLIYLTYPIPKVVFMPILLILLGIGDVSKIVLITLIVFYQILVTTRDAAKNFKKEYVLSVQSLGATSGELYRHVYLPGCLPAILTSLRLGLGTALAVLFLVETYATQKGVGYFIMNALSRMAYEEMFAGIIAMGAIGYVLYLILDVTEKFLCSWAKL